MGIDFSLLPTSQPWLPVLSWFAVVFILFYRRGAL